MRTLVFGIILCLIVAGVLWTFLMARPKKSRKLTRAETQELIALREMREAIENETGNLHGEPVADLVRHHVVESYRKQRMEL
jgi:hypothetical protein